MRVHTVPVHFRYAFFHRTPFDYIPFDIIPISPWSDQREMAQRYLDKQSLNDIALHTLDIIDAYDTLNTCDKTTLTELIDSLERDVIVSIIPGGHDSHTCEIDGLVDLDSFLKNNPGDTPTDSLLYYTFPDLLSTEPLNDTQCDALRVNADDIESECPAFFPTVPAYIRDASVKMGCSF